jgi:isoleucyl-tRNA synthetase
MTTIKLVDGRCDFPKLEDEITDFWKKGKIFEKSVEQRDENNRYAFVDGPPFVSGLPHPGTLAVSVVKDIIPRYWTMKGKKVRRVFGWDCHGLPIESKVDKKFNIRDRKQVEEEIGVDKYVGMCREYVEQHIADWRWYIDKVGRWVDLDNAYRTMDPEFNQSVIWAFKQFYDKGLVYKGKRVSLFSTDTSTPVSEFEVAMDSDNYRDTEDLSIFVKFRILDKKFKEETFVVAWTTTPWTMPSNFALAVNEKYEYCLVKFKGESLIVAKERLEYTFGEEKFEIVEEFKGKELEGLSYEPLFDFFVSEKTENDFKIYLYEGVTIEEGTGILHVAPAFGAEDHELGLKHGISAIADIDEKGILTVGSFKGIYIRDASDVIAQEIEKKGQLLRSEKYVHRLPYYRGKNPLIYMAQDSYLINIQKIKGRILELNENVNWYPEHYKHKRFAETVKTSPDWNISRTRYWATVMPIWESEDGDQIVVGSFEEMMEYTDQIEKRVEDGKVKYFFEGEKLHLHRDMCDKIVFTKEGKEYHRIPEVLDGWLDSASVPFAEYGYPFENEDVFKNAFPADFVVEYSAQIRAWFGMLFRVSTVLFDKEPFKNVLCHGVLNGSDGRKMSKSFGNYTDPKEVLDTLGGEAFRLYMMSTTLMAGGDTQWDDGLLRDQMKNVLIPIWNTYRYLTLYANQHYWTPENTEYIENTILDQWLKSYMDNVSLEYSKMIEEYNIPGSVKLIQPTIDAISSWWIRRSRDRFASGDVEALQNLYAALVQFAKTFAPQMPFLTESIYQNLVVNSRSKELKNLFILNFFQK